MHMYTDVLERLLQDGYYHTTTPVQHVWPVFALFSYAPLARFFYLRSRAHTRIMSNITEVHTNLHAPQPSVQLVGIICI